MELLQWHLWISNVFWSNFLVMAYIYFQFLIMQCVHIILANTYSKTCSKLRHSKLLQKNSVSYFVCSIAKCFLSLLFNIADVTSKLKYNNWGRKQLKSSF
jgi:hypothetical protein